MKKILTSLLLIIFLTTVLSAVAFAANIDFVTDFTGSLTENQKGRLNERAERISAQYRCDVAIIIVNNMEGYSNAELYAEDFFTWNSFGYGSDSSGVMLLLSLEERNGGRDFALIAKGFGNTAFTDYGKEVIERQILPHLRGNRFNEAFTIFLDKAEEFLSMARDGTPFDRHTDPNAEGTSILIKLAVVIFIPLIVAFLICSVWKSQMKTARVAATACNYIPPGGFQLTGSADTFLYRTVTRTKIQQKSSSGGTTVNSRGFSGRSGKF